MIEINGVGKFESVDALIEHNTRKIVREGLAKMSDEELQKLYWEYFLDLLRNGNWKDSVKWLKSQGKTHQESIDFLLKPENYKDGIVPESLINDPIVKG